MKRKVGLATHSWWIDGDMVRFEQELRIFEKSGAEYCELKLQGLDAIAGGRLVPERIRQIQKILLWHDTLRTTLHLGLHLPDARSAISCEQIFRAGIALAQELDCEAIVYHAGGEPEPPMERQLEMLLRLLEQTGDILLCMENVPLYGAPNDCMGASAESMAAFCKRVGHPNFRLAFDIGHSFLANRADKAKLLADLNLLLPYAGYIHLHDNFGIPSQTEPRNFGRHIVLGEGDLHLPLGWGEVPVTEVLQALAAYEGIIMLEIEKRFEDQYAACVRKVSGLPQP